MACSSAHRLPLLLLLLLAPAPALALWKQGWELTGSLCQGNLPATCSVLCSSWSQSDEGTCVAAAPNSIAAGKWSSLTLDTETSATFRLFSDAACTTQIPLCNFTGATVDGSCVHRLMCDPSVQGLETQYSYRFELIKRLPGYVIALAIFFGGVVPLFLIVLACYCCFCRGRAKTTDELKAEPQENSRGTYSREQREMENAQRHPPRRASLTQQRGGSPTREEERAREFAERQRQHQQLAHAVGSVRH